MHKNRHAKINKCKMHFVPTYFSTWKNDFICKFTIYFGFGVTLYKG